MAPFAFVDPEIGKVIWFAISVILIAVFLWQSIQLLPDRRRAVRWLAWITLLLIAKFLVKELVNGQTNVLLGATVMAAIAARRAGRQGLAGVLIGAAVFIKPYAILFIPWLALTGAVAATVAAGAIVALGLALPALVYGWHTNTMLLVDWYHTVRDTTPENQMLPENISFLTMWSKWIGADRSHRCSRRPLPQFHFSLPPVCGLREHAYAHPTISGWHSSSCWSR